MKIVQPCSALCFLAGLAIFFPPSSPAQTGAEAWVRRYGTIKNSWGQFNKVVTDNAGNVIVAGYADTGVTGRDCWSSNTPMRACRCGPIVTTARGAVLTPPPV